MIDSMRHARSGTPSRHGTSLIEMVVVMGIATVMLTLAVTTIHMLLRAEWTATETVWYGTSLARFSHVLRQDVHAAVDADIAPPPPAGTARLELTLPKQRTATYQIDRNKVTRTEADAERARHHDTYHFPPGSNIRFEQTQQPEFVRVVIDRPSAPETSVDRKDGRGKSSLSTRRIFHIEAAVARDHRFAPRDQ